MNGALAPGGGAHPQCIYGTAHSLSFAYRATEDFQIEAGLSGTAFSLCFLLGWMQNSKPHRLKPVPLVAADTQESGRPSFIGTIETLAPPEPSDRPSARAASRNSQEKKRRCALSPKRECAPSPMIFSLPDNFSGSLGRLTVAHRSWVHPTRQLFHPSRLGLC